MNLELDKRLRSAVFAHVQRLRDANGGVVFGRDLAQGIMFDGAKVPFWNLRKGIFKPAFLGSAGAALTIQTAYESPYDDKWDAQDDRIAYKYRGQDPFHADNRALRQAMVHGRPLIYFVGLAPGVYEPVMPCYVTDDDPGDLTFFLVADAEGFVGPNGDGGQQDWPRKAYITREVKKRLHQDRFRYLVIGAYREQCAMCRLRHVQLLEAAHIIPDRDPLGMPEVPNGLSLCRIHHGAFDVGILGVDPDYRIHLRQDVLDEHDGPMLRHGLQELHHTRIQLPRRQADRPNRDYLQVRFEAFRAA